jgi:hypothetical protein
VEEGGVKIDAVIAGFEEAFFHDPEQIESEAGKQTTWKSAYMPYLRRLQKVANSEDFSEAVLVAALQTYKSASRSKQMAAGVYARLARATGLQLPEEWHECSSGYQPPRKADENMLIDKTVIASSIEKIPNQSWRRVFALIAVYGLKNYEPFFVDFQHLQGSSSLTAKVCATDQFNERFVWPVPADWAINLGINHISCIGDLPSVATDLSVTTLQQIGRRCAEQFKRYGLPVTPSQLRYSWGARAIRSGVPDSLAAKMLGIDVVKYFASYKTEIEERDLSLFASSLIGSDPPF